VNMLEDTNNATFGSDGDDVDVVKDQSNRKPGGSGKGAYE